MVSPLPAALVLALAWPNLVAGDAKSPRKLKAEAFIVTGHPTPPGAPHAFYTSSGR